MFHERIATRLLGEQVEATTKQLLYMLYNLFSKLAETCTRFSNKINVIQSLLWVKLRRVIDKILIGLS